MTAPASGLNPEVLDDLQQVRKTCAVFKAAGTPLQLWEAYCLARAQPGLLSRLIRRYLEQPRDVPDLHPELLETLRLVRDRLAPLVKKVRKFLPLSKGTAEDFECSEFALGVLLTSPKGRESAARWAADPIRYEREAAAELQVLVGLMEMRRTAARSEGQAPSGIGIEIMGGKTEAAFDAAAAFPPSGTPPSEAPAQLAASPRNGRVLLTWKIAAGALGYTIKRSTAPGGPCSPIAVNVVTTAYVDGSVTNGVTYEYVVCGVNGAGEGPASAPAQARPIGPPAAPAGLEAAPGNMRVSLAWRATEDASGYTLKRATSAAGPYATIAQPTGLSYADTDVRNGTRYFYVVIASNASGESPHSPAVEVMPVDPSTPPADLAAEAGNARVTLTWTASLDAASYNVKRAASPAGPFAVIAQPARPPFTDTKVANGTTYFYAVSAVNAAGESGNANPVAAKPVAPPEAPFGLSAEPGNGQVALRWTAVPEAAGYAVKRASPPGGPFYTIAAAPGPSYVDASVTNGATYAYVVAASNAGGESPPSPEAQATPVGPPPAPVGLSAFPGNGRVSLIWPPSKGATSYSVKRSTNRGGPFEPIARPPSTTYVDTAVTNGTACYYVVTAVNAGGESALSPLATVTPVDPSTAPTGLSATAGHGRVSLVWLACKDAAHYNLKRATTRGGPYAAIATPMGTSYVDAQVQNGTTYYYVVSAVNAAGESANSSQAQATPMAPPPAPAGLTAMAGNTRVSLTWTSSPEAASHHLKRATSPAGPFVTVIAHIPGTSHIDGTVTNGTTYYYVVTAVNAGGESPPSPPAQAAPVGPPEIPSGLMASPGNLRVALAWTGSPAATHYSVKRAPSPGGPYTPIASPSAPSYVDTAVANGTTYFYVVSALSAGGESAPSGEVQAAPVAPPPAPARLSAQAGNSRVLLEWTLCADAETYTVKRSTARGGPYDAVAPVGNVTSFTDTTVANGTTYEYVVCGVNAGGEGPHSPPAQATPFAPPAAPESLAARPGNGRVWLMWTPSAGATGYVVRRSAGGAAPAMIGTVSGETAYTDASVANGTLYAYTVSAVNPVGEGPASAPAEALPVDPPPAPQGLVGTPGNGRVSLAWQAAAGARSYNVKRAASPGGPYETVATPTLTSYTDTEVVNGASYFYVVSAGNPGGESPPSALAQVTPVGPPAAPANLAAAPGNAHVALTWSPSPGATHYFLKRATSPGGPFEPVGGKLALPSFVDTGLANGTKYFYVVTALNAGGEGPHSAPLDVAPMGPPPAPADFAAAPGNAVVRLSWRAVPEATGYVVKRALPREEGFTVLARPSAPSYEDASVTNGTAYLYAVSAANAGGEGPETAPVEARPVDPPLAPTGLVAAPGNARVSLAWSASNDATGYHVKRATSPAGPYAVVAPNVAGTSYSDTAVANGTAYYYRVSAVNAGGESPETGPSAATPVAPPPPPTGLTASPGNGWVSVAWNPSAGATSYNVRRTTTRGGPYTLIATNVAATKYSDTTVVNGTTYYYVITALNAGGESAFSSGGSKMLVAPPAPPASLSASAGNARVTLSWPESPGATRYNVKRAAGPGAPYAVIGSPTATGYTDMTVVNGRTYDYVVTAVNAGGESGPSSLAQATPVDPPDVPTGLSAAAGNASVALCWNAARGADSYNVKRSAFAGGPYGTIATIVAGTKYTDGGISNGTTYYYVVSALNPAGESGHSHAAKATPEAPPAAPAHLEGSVGNGKVLLTWVAVPGAAKYNIKRSTAAEGGFVTIGIATGVTFTDNSVTNGTAYHYVVSAVNAGGEGPESAAIEALPMDPPPAPMGVTAMPGNGKTTLSWTECPGASSYSVKRSTGPGGPFVTVANPTTNLFIDTAVANGSTYYYVVGAANAGGKSPSSNRVSATPGAEPPPPPVRPPTTRRTEAPPAPPEGARRATEVRAAEPVRDTPSAIWPKGVEAQKLIDLRQARRLVEGAVDVRLWEVLSAIASEGASVRIAVEQLLRVRQKGDTAVFSQTMQTFIGRIMKIRSKYAPVAEKIRELIGQYMPGRFEPEVLEITLALLLSDPKGRPKAESWLINPQKHKQQAVAHLEVLRGLAINYLAALKLN